MQHASDSITLTLASIVLKEHSQYLRFMHRLGVQIQIFLKILIVFFFSNFVRICSVGLNAWMSGLRMSSWKNVH